MIGRTLGHYRIASRLGQGGMGEVYLAEDIRLHRKVALKLLPPEMAGDPERRRRFEREAQAVAALNHPNIVMVHSVEEAQGVPFITMELVEGRNLSDLIPKDGLPLGRFFELAVPLADAIGAVHERGITHRDLKPENVMVTSEGRVKVLDFGLAKLMERTPAGEAASQRHTTTTEPGRILGTLYYMSPEQAEGKPVDHRSDVFSLGVVLYVMATGRRPFEGDTPASILSSVLKDTPPSVTEQRPSLPRDLGRIVRLCLHKDPERRYQTAKDIRNELEELKKEVDSGALQLPVAEPARRPLGTVAAAAGLGVIALGLSIYALFFRRESAESAWEIKPLTTFQGVEGSPTWSPDGTFIAYDALGPGGTDIYMMATYGGVPVRLTQSPPENRLPRWSPTGKYIAFLSDRGAETAICLIHPEPGPAWELVRIPAVTDFGRLSGGSLGAMPWSPDGKALLFPRDGVLWSINVDTRAETRLTDPGVEVVKAAWSPDGERIVFEGVQAGRSGLWLLPAVGGKPSPLVVDEHTNRDPAWSADSRRIVFARTHGAGWYGNLWDVEVDSRRLRQVSVGSVNEADPVVARDGRVAFVQFREGADLHVTRVADRSDRQITSHRGGSYNARFSPDGKRLVYASTQSGAFEIRIRELATGAERRLGLGSIPDWSPDGLQVVFSSPLDDGVSRLSLLDVNGGAPRRLMEQPIAFEGAMRWAPDGRAIGFYAANEVWAVDPDGGNPRRLLPGGRRGGPSVVPDFDWYRGSRHAVYMRQAEDGSLGREMVVRDLESGREVVLHSGALSEPIASRDGGAIAFCVGPHLRQDLWVLRLRPPDAADGLPEPIGDPQPLTDGKGAWHVHNGGWSPDGEEIVFTHAEPEGEILVIENYR